jgi:hypothetical protein
LPFARLVHRHICLYLSFYCFSSYGAHNDLKHHRWFFSSQICLCLTAWSSDVTVFHVAGERSSFGALW